MNKALSPKQMFSPRLKQKEAQKAKERARHMTVITQILRKQTGRSKKVWL